MNPLQKSLCERIGQSGPLTVAEYMELALAHPEYGYYRKQDPLGEAGDFTTAPEISQMFGELLGAWSAQLWSDMGRPECQLIELGPGRGTLMADLLRITRAVPGFHDAITLHLVETSPALQAKQKATLQSCQLTPQWHDTFEAIPGGQPFLLLANEFFDALPIRQFVKKNSQWYERLVDTKEETLCFTIASSPADISSSLPYDPSAHSDAETIEICPAAQEITALISKRIQQDTGAALLIDYGYTRGSRTDTLQALRRHEYADPLAGPGDSDLTAHVDFLALQAIAEALGMATYGPVRQGDFLNALGLPHRLHKILGGATKKEKETIITGAQRLIAPDQMGELFKALAFMHPSLPIPPGLVLTP